MDRQAFKNRMQQLKQYREQNPGKTYLDFKKYSEGGEHDTKVTDSTSGLQGYYDLPHNRFVIPVTEDYSNDSSAHAYLPEVTITASVPKTDSQKLFATNIDAGILGTSSLEKAEDIAEFTDYGDVKDFLDSSKKIYNGQYEEGLTDLGAQAAFMGLGAAIPFISGKGLKTLYRYGRMKLNPVNNSTTAMLKDVITQPIETWRAYKDGLYPLTYKQRREYLEKAHKQADLALIQLNDNNIKDAAYRKKTYPSEDHSIIQYNDAGINMDYAFNSKSYRKFNDIDSSRGVNYPRWKTNSHISLLKKKGSRILRPIVDVTGTTVHEVEHSWQRWLKDLDDLSTYDIDLKSFVPNKNNKAYTTLELLNKNRGEWEGSPRELLSELQKQRVSLDAPRYNLMTPSQQKKVREYISQEFELGLEETHKMLTELAEMGYADGGEIPPSNKPVIPEEPQQYKGKLYKDRYGRKYTEDQVNEYYEGSTDEIDRFTGKPFVRGLKPVGDIEDAANVTPVGDAISAYDTYKALKNKDWEGAGLAAMGLIPFIPSLGGVAVKSSKKISKPKSTYIPKVDPNYKQNVIDRALHEQNNYSNMPLNVIEEINDQRNRAYDLMQEPYARERAKAVDHQYGTDYLKVYDSMLEKYVDVDEYFQLPEPKYKKMERPTIGAQVTPSEGNTMYFNRDMIKTPEDIPNSVVLHEMGHLVDGATGMNNEFLKKLGDKSKFIPFNQAKTMYPNMTKDMYNSILQGTEIKSYMNQFRNYLDQKGKLNRGNYIGGYKNLKKEIIDAPRESFNNIKAIFNLYRSPKLFNKDFQMIPVVNNNDNNTIV